MKRYIRSSVGGILNEPSDIQLEMASDPNMDAHTLTLLASLKDTQGLVEDTVEVLRAVASNPNTPVEALDNLIKRPTVQSLRRRVANNPNTSVSTLRMLSNDVGDATTRYFVAKNPNTPLDIVESFVNDPEADVRYGLLERKSLPGSVILGLISDPDDDIRSELVDYIAVHHMPIDIIHDVTVSLVNDEARIVRWSVAANPFTDTDTLHKLVDDPDYTVRWEVARNDNTSIEDLKHLLSDEKPSVVKSATKSLKSRGIEV